MENACLRYAIANGLHGCTYVITNNEFSVKLLQDHLISHQALRSAEVMPDYVGGVTDPPWADAHMPESVNRAVKKWVAYMDESGNRTGNDIEGEGSLFVLACVTGSPDTLARLADMVRGMKRGLAPNFDPDLWELHGKEIMHGPEKKPYRTPVPARTVLKKIAILQGVVDIVHELGVDVVVAMVPSKKIRKNHGKNHVIEHAMTVLIERLEAFARQHGIDELRIVSDEMRDVDQERVSAILSNMSSGRSAISSVRAAHLSGIEYVSSMSSVLNQVADIVAYTINRHEGGAGGLAGVFGVLSKSISTGLAREGTG